MRLVQLWPNGVSGGVTHMGRRGMAKRDKVQGWSVGSSRRNTRFLYSVDAKRLPSFGLAVSLTVRDCPPDASSWQRARRAWEACAKREGATAVHWLTEWQRRGVPHLHAALMFADGYKPGVNARLWSAWLRIAKPWGALGRGQMVKPITDPVGWFGYVSKHGGRGVRHYQRSAANIPPGWQGRTGRMWGHSGEWPTRDPLRVEMDRKGFAIFRRLVRSWRIADARADGNPRRIARARRMLKANSPEISAVRGLSEWITLEEATGMILAVEALGGLVQSEGDRANS